MFDKLKQMAGLLGNLPRIKGEMEKLQQQLAQLTAEGVAGAGMVKIRVNGKMEVLSCTLSDEAVKLGDRELLEDLIVGAANQALERIRQQIAEETGKMAAGLGLPPGMGIPGLQLPGT